jgi:two-component system, NtrC family, response regulator HydG
MTSEGILQPGCLSDQEIGRLRKNLALRCRMSKLHVLVVDDDRDFAESLADVLRSDGHWVDTAYSGEEAILRFPLWHYDLTFMDVRLPGRNGVESLLELRKLRPDAQVYMMTGFSMEHLLERALAVGARGVLQKPLDLDRVLQLLKEMQSCQILIADDDPDFVAGIDPRPRM